jgi:hypothetical protein
MTATEKLPEEDWLVSAEQVKEHVVLIRAPSACEELVETSDSGEEPCLTIII